MSKLLSVFLDGIKPSSVKHMPFLSSFENKANLTTDVGFSTTCHASMYSGVYPEKHGIWHSMLYNPTTSPYKWLEDSGVSRIPDLDILKYLAFRATKKFGKRNDSFFGIQYIRTSSFKNWPKISFSEEKFWTDESYLTAYDSIFDILRKNKISFETPGLIPGQRLHFSSKIVDDYELDFGKEWTYLFMADIDPLSHIFLQESEECIERMKYIDKIIMEKYEQLEKQHGKVRLMCWSDHGHTEVKKHINIKKIFNFHKVNLDNILYLVDSTFVRFWPRDNGEEKKIRDVMKSLENKGGFFTEEYIKNHHVDFSDKRYGSLIYYIDPPYAFSNTHSPFLYMREYKNNISMHGYRPEIKDMDGFFVSSDSINKSRVTLQDMFVSTLSSLNLKIPEYVDGKDIYKL